MGLAHQFHRSVWNAVYALTRIPSAGRSVLITFSSPCRRCRMLCFQTLLWAHGLNFHQSWRQGGRWLRWHKSRAGEKSSLYPAASSLTGEEGSPICSGSARACKIALAQICAHPIWHGCVGMAAEEPCDPKRALFFSHAIISSGNTCLCSLVLLQPISTWKAVTLCT